MLEPSSVARHNRPAQRDRTDDSDASTHTPTVSHHGAPNNPRALTPLDTARSFMDDNQPCFIETSFTNRERHIGRRLQSSPSGTRRSRAAHCSFRVRLSRSAALSSRDDGAAGVPARSGSVARLVEVLVELDEVVGRGHEARFGARGGPAAAVKAAEAAVVFGVAEDRLDELAALAVEHASTFGCEDAAHEVVGAAVPARAWARVASAA